jgi:uncharacterized phage-associated protein
LEQIRFDCDFEKITQILNFFAIKSGGTINKMKALKLLYFSDRYHLRKYGRLISNDNYMAMENGPVPSTAKDIAELNNDFLCDEKTLDYSSRYIKPDSRKLHLASIAAMDESVFSDSDIEALNFAWEHFGHLDQYQLARLTHKYPEWKKQEENINTLTRCVQMDLLDFFDDPDADIEKCFALDNQDRTARREHLAQMAHLESLWS